MSRFWIVGALVASAAVACTGCQPKPETTVVNGEFQGVTFANPNASGREYTATLVKEHQRIAIVITDEPDGCAAAQRQAPVIGPSGEVRGTDGGVVPSLWLDVEKTTHQTKGSARFHDARGSVVAQTATIDLYDTFDREKGRVDDSASGTFTATFDGGGTLSGEFVAARCSSLPEQSCASLPGTSVFAALTAAGLMLAGRRRRSP